jgi:Na+/melibiose symporter-like transporter
VAGVVIDAFNWHMLFYGLTPLALLTIVIAYFYLDNFGTPKDVQLDITSVVLSTLGFGGLLYGFSVIGSSGFSPVVMASLLVGASALAMFIYRQLHMEEPLLKMHLLKNRTFAISVMLVMLVNAALIVGGILMPIYVQTIRGFSATMSSLIMLPSALVSAFMSPISGRMFDKFGARRLAIPGLVIIITASFMLTMLTETTSLIYVGVVYCFRMLGLSLINMPLNTWGLNSLENSVMSHGTAIGNTFRNVACSLGTALLITVMSLTIAFAPDPASNMAQIAGINNAYLGGTIMMVIALVLAFLFVKVEK